MKNLLLIALIALFSNNCFSKEKSTKETKHQHLTYEEYMNKFGDNKTSITVINIFFDKRDNAGIGKMSFLPLTTSIAIVYPPIGVGLMAISSPLFVSGMITRSKYSHKNLIETLEVYQSNQTLPQKLKKKVGEIHKIEEEIRQEELQEARYASLKEIKNTSRKIMKDEKTSNKNILGYVSK